MYLRVPFSESHSPLEFEYMKSCAHKSWSIIEGGGCSIRPYFYQTLIKIHYWLVKFNLTCRIWSFGGIRLKLLFQFFSVQTEQSERSQSLASSNKCNIKKKSHSFSHKTLCRPIHEEDQDPNLIKITKMGTVTVPVPYPMYQNSNGDWIWWLSASQ